MGAFRALAVRKFCARKKGSPPVFPKLTVPVAGAKPSLAKFSAGRVAPLAGSSPRRRMIESTEMGACGLPVNDERVRKRSKLPGRSVEAESVVLAGPVLPTLTSANRLALAMMASKD